MEETTTSWKNHSFTLLVFGGIVVLCSIFFVLGMLVGRNQGQRIAEEAFASEAKNKPVAVAADAFKLDYYVETTEEKPDPKLQPATEPPPAEPGVSVTPAVSGSSSSARSGAPSVKPQLTASTKKTAVKPSTAKPATSKTAPASKDKYLQVMATKNQKQAREEQKRVQSKGFKALIMDVTQKNERLYRVMVGPYKESELSLAQADLKAKGYKETIIR